MTSDAARERFAGARVARLASSGPDGQPHLVAIVFALLGDRIVHAVDHKPKRTRELRRLENIRADPRVSVLADHYDDDDWSALWWVRADGLAQVLPAGSAEEREAIAALTARYAQYRQRPLIGPVVAIDVERWSGWSGAG